MSLIIYKNNHKPIQLCIDHVKYLVFCCICGAENEKYLCNKCYSNINTGLIEELEEMKFEILQQNIKNKKTPWSA